MDDVLNELLNVMKIGINSSNLVVLSRDVIGERYEIRGCTRHHKIRFYMYMALWCPYIGVPDGAL